VINRLQNEIKPGFRFFFEGSNGPNTEKKKNIKKNLNIYFYSKNFKYLFLFKKFKFHQKKTIKKTLQTKMQTKPLNLLIN
jgi:hypothetical protein